MHRHADVGQEGVTCVQRRRTLQQELIRKTY